MVGSELSPCEHRENGDDQMSVELSSNAAAWEIGEQRVARIPSALCCGRRIAMDRFPQCRLEERRGHGDE